MKKIKIPFFKNIKKRAESYAKLFIAGDEIPVDSNVSMNTEKMLTLSAFWACIRVISEDVSSMPIDLFKYENNQKKFAIDNKWFKILKRTCNNRNLLTQTLIETTIINMLLWGNGYIQIIRNKLGEPIELYPLLSSRMRIISGKLLTYEYLKDDGTIRKFRQDQIININMFSLDGVHGLSIIKYANNSTGLTFEAEKFGRNFFKNGTRLSGVLEMETGTKLKDKDGTIKEWQNRYSGTDNTGKVAVLEGGMKYKNIGIPPEDAQFLETRQFQTTEICRWFRVPPHKIGDLSRATFSNIEQQNIDYLSNIKPITKKIEGQITNALFENQDVFLKFNTDSLLMGDFKSRMEGYGIAIQNGIFTPNEVRSKENVNSIESGDELIVNGNMISLESALKNETGNNASGNIKNSNKD